MANTKLPVEVLYMTTEESRTFGFDFSAEGAVKGGETLSSPEVSIEALAGAPTAGTPLIITEDFYDGDSGNKILAGKGVRVRITGGSAGTFKVACRVTTSGGDVLEISAKIVVGETV